MSKPAMRPPAALAALAAASLCASLCGGCTDYLARRDTLTLGSGEAVQANIAKQVIDPWPRHAMTVDPYTDGSRVQRAVERYRNPVTGPNLTVLPPVPIGPGNVPSVAPPPGQL